MSGSGAERRRWPRIPASLLTNVSTAIIAGPDVKLVNLSRGGALMEVAARYPMRSKVRLKVTRAAGDISQINGTVSWAKVASISNGKINYLLAVIFENPVEDLSALTGIPDVENHAAVSTDADPFLEDADLPVTMVRGAAAEVQAHATTEEDLSSEIFTPLATLAPSPGAPNQGDGAAHTPDAEAPGGTADLRVGDLRCQLERAAADLAALSAANDNLSAQLSAFDDERIRLRGELDAARLRWEEEKVALARASGETEARLADLQGTLLAHQQSGGQALAEHQALTQALSSRIDALDTERHALRAERATERERWDAERARLAAEVGDAMGRAVAVQEALAARDQQAHQALADAQALQQALQVRLEGLEGERLELLARLDSERRERHDEREAFERASADAAARLADAEQQLQHFAKEHQRAADLGMAAEGLRERIQALEAEQIALEETFQAERQAWDEERRELVRRAADARTEVELLTRTFQARQDEQVRAVTEQQALVLTLRTQLEALTGEQAEARRAADAERDEWNEERARLHAEAQVRSEEFQAALEAREQVHAETLAATEARFEALVAELVQAANDQQAEYQQLMAERTAALEEQVSRTERLHAELLRVRHESDVQRTTLEQHGRDLESRLTAAEAIGVAYETRSRAIRREAERLVSLLSAPATDWIPMTHDLGSTGDPAQAVAGG